MKTLRKIAGLLLIISMAGSINAQDTGCTVKRSFGAADGIYLKISNKFGDISIWKSDGDSLTICATITIKQSDRALAEKSKGMVKTDIERHSDTIVVQTRFDDRFFYNSYNKGRTGFSVDYVINLPATSNLEIRNSFGDVTLDEIDGMVMVRLSNGDFTADKLLRGNIKPVSSLDFENSKVNISEANWLTVSAKHCQSVVIDNAKALLLNTEFSKLNLGDISSVVCESRSDNYDIESIRNLVGVSTLSQFHIGELSGQLQIKSGFGSLSIGEVLNEFSLIDIAGSGTPVEIGFQKGASYKVDLLLSKCSFDTPFTENSMLNEYSAGNNHIITGIAGNKKETRSMVKIRLDLGRLEIR